MKTKEKLRLMEEIRRKNDESWRNHAMTEKKEDSNMLECYYIRYTYHNMVCHNIEMNVYGFSTLKSAISTAKRIKKDNPTARNICVYDGTSPTDGSAIIVFQLD